MEWIKGKGMITALVQFKLPQPVTRDKASPCYSAGGKISKWQVGRVVPAKIN